MYSTRGVWQADGATGHWDWQRLRFVPPGLEQMHLIEEKNKRLTGNFVNTTTKYQSYFYKFAFYFFSNFFLAYILKKSNYHSDYFLGCLQFNLWVADWLRPVWRPWLRRSNYLTKAIGLLVSHRGWRVPYRFPSLWSWRTWWCWWAAAGPERKHGPESPQSTPTSPVRRPDTRSPCSEAA